jgi:hypothetical protein
VIELSPRFLSVADENEVIATVVHLAGSRKVDHERGDHAQPSTVELGD